MNEIQIISNYSPFVVTGAVLSALWALAYVCSWLVQWARAWVDESEAGKDNWIAAKVSRDRAEPLNGWHKENRFWMYYKYKDGKEIDFSDLPFLADPYFSIFPLIWVGVICLNFWYVSMWFGMAYAVAFTMRMARRGQKILTKHMEDKEAHK